MLEHDGARVTRVRGDDADVFSRGYLCPKGVALKDLHEDPDRLRTPLIKRAGAFVPASWDEAFAEIAARLPALRDAHGADAIATVLGNPVAHKMGLQLYFPRLARALGTRNLYSASTLDQLPKMLASGLMYGSWLSVAVPDLERSDYLLVIGANPMVSNGSMWTVPDYRGKAKAMRARGGRIVVVDPRRTETAQAADRHHFIRPGADVFFLLGLVHTLFDENLARPGALAAHLAGVDEVRAAVLPYAPERVAPRCAVTAAEIRAIARELAAAPRGAVYGRIGTCTQEFGTLCSWLVDVLNALTGNLDREGGAMFPRAPAFAANTRGQPGTGRGVATGRYRARVSGAPEVTGELPLACLAEEIETPGPGQVRGLIVIAGNPVLSAPNGPRLAAALERLEFMVSLDIYLNETSRHAHVILPGLSPLEEAHYDVAFTQLAYRNHARYSPPVLPRPAGLPEEWETLLRLTAILRGAGANADLAALDEALLREELEKSAGPAAAALMAALGTVPGPERLLDLGLRSGPYGDQFGRAPGGLTLARLQAAPSGIDLGPLAPRVPELLRTPSGRIELAPAPLLADLARVAARIGDAASPLVLIGRRQLRSNNSWMHNLPVLAKGPYRCTLLVNPHDAARHGVSDGGAALLRAGARTLAVTVEVSAEMMEGVVSLPHGWGHDLPGAGQRLAAARPGANLNVLCDEDRRDPLSGNAVLSAIPVSLE